MLITSEPEFDYITASAGACIQLFCSANLGTCSFVIELVIWLDFKPRAIYLKGKILAQANTCINHNFIKELMSGRFDLTKFQFCKAVGYLLHVKYFHVLNCLLIKGVELRTSF